MISLNDTILSNQGDEFVLIHGPSHVTLTKGSLKIFGKSFTHGETFVIPHGKTVPVILGPETRASDLRVKSGIAGALELISENPIPKLWNDLATQLIESQKALWMIIGGPDTGKTGFITFLVNQCLQNQKKMAIIDSDLGQSNIGPPTIIGLAVPSAPEIFLSKHKMQTGYFVGSTSPRNHLLQTCCGVRKLVDTAYAMGAELILLDTSGYIVDPTARALKYHKAVLIDPSSILALQRSNELEYILESLQSLCPIVRMTPPAFIQLKDHNARSIYRERLFKKTFADARLIAFSADVRLLGTSLSFEDPITDYRRLEILLDTKILWVQRISNILFVVIGARFSDENIPLLKEEFGVKHINIIDYRDLQGLIVGLLAEGHKFLALGILQDIHFGEKIVVRTAFDRPELVKFITLGRIQLTPEGKQIGRIPVGYI